MNSSSQNTFFNSNNSNCDNSFGFCLGGKTVDRNNSFGIGRDSYKNGVNSIAVTPTYYSSWTAGFGAYPHQTTDGNSCYNSFGNTQSKKESERKDDNMSFVGIGLCHDGFLAFADSKSTLTDPLGNSYYDEKRGDVKKVFKGKKYLLVSHGANQLFDLHGVKTNLETIIDNLISEDLPYFRIIEEILAITTSHQNNQGIFINFIVGSIDDYGPFVQGVYLENEAMILRRKIRRQGIYTGGATWYTNGTNSISFDGRKDVEQNLQNVVESVQNMINVVDKIAVYNPVGAPIVTEKLLFKEFQ